MRAYHATRDVKCPDFVTRVFETGFFLVFIARSGDL